MDKFITISREKEIEEITGRDSQLLYIKSLLESNTSFCIHGAIGVGKTFLIKHALIGIQYIDLALDFFKIERIKDMQVHVLADMVEVSEPLSLGSTIVISDKPVENFECIKLEPLSYDVMVSIGLKKFPMSNRDSIMKHALVSKGDMRIFLFRLADFTDIRDLFKSPKDFVYDLLCKGGDLEARDYIGKVVAEHGYSWGIVHENYLDTPGADMAYIADMMSLADIKDVDIYNGYSHNAIFSLFGILLPAIAINHTLDRCTMRPGSAWTKFNNYKMRHRRYQVLGLGIDELMVISQYCKSKSDVIDMLVHYKFESVDVDMMNHISLINKIKPRVLQNIKTKLKLLAKE